MNRKILAVTSALSFGFASVSHAGPVRSAGIPSLKPLDVAERCAAAADETMRKLNPDNSPDDGMYGILQPDGKTVKPATKAEAWKNARDECLQDYKESDPRGPEPLPRITPAEQSKS